MSGPVRQLSAPLSGSRQRLDKWLWFARLCKSRTLAQKLVAAGKVRINREREDSPSHLVKAGDTLTVTLESGVRVLRILDTGIRRGPAAEAQRLYEDLAPPGPPVKATESFGFDPGGRPGKHDRKRLAAMKRGDPDDA